MKDYVSALKKEHQNILNELDKLKTKIESIEKEAMLLKAIKEFVKNNSNYIREHLIKEEIFYEYLNKELGNNVDLKELTKSKETITEELSRLEKINGSNGISEVKRLVKNFIQGVKERISFEEETLFEIADNGTEKGVFE
jgi:hemerythrin-like domain-containing protein